MTGMPEGEVIQTPKNPWLAAAEAVTVTLYAATMIGWSAWALWRAIGA